MLLTRRLTQLLVGLALYGVSLALVLRAGLGLAPWDVLHQGLAEHLDATVGQMVIAVSFVVLLLWIPLRERPGFGTFANAVLVGVFVDLTLLVLDPAQAWPARVLLLLGGVLLNGLATALYIGASLGPGPRDGLMTGLVRRTGRSVRLVRTLIEVTVLRRGVPARRHRGGRDAALRGRDRTDRARPPAAAHHRVTTGRRTGRIESAA